MAKKKARRAGKVSIKPKSKLKATVPTVLATKKELLWVKNDTVDKNYKRLKVVADVNKDLRSDSADEGPTEIPLAILQKQPKPPKFRPMPEGEMSEIRPLIRKHGQNLKKMVRDKANRWQRTEVQLARMIEHYHKTLEHRKRRSRETSGQDANAEEV